MSDKPGMFRQTPGVVRRGITERAENPDPSPQVAGIERPVWRSFVGNEAFQKVNAPLVKDEQRRMAEAARPDPRPRVSAERMPKWKSGIGTLQVERPDGVIEDYDPESLLDDPEVGNLAAESLWKRDMKAAADERDALKFRLADPSDTRRMTAKEREDALLTGGSLAETDPQHVALKKRLMDDEARTADEQAAYDADARVWKLTAGGVAAWRAGREAARSVGERSGRIAAKELEIDAAEESAVAEERALDEKMRRGVSGAEVGAIQARKAEIAAARQGMEAARAEVGTERQGVAAAARREADGMDGKPSVPASEKMASALQAAGLFGSATAAMGAGSSIGRKADGNWDLPLMAPAQDNGFVQGMATLAVTAGQKLGARLDAAGPAVDKQAIQKVFHDFQQAEGLSDEEMAAAWNDLGIFNRKFEDGEKARVTSQGQLVPNAGDSDWLDTAAATAIVEGSSASPESKATTLANLPAIQEKIAAAKAKSYEEAVKERVFIDEKIPLFSKFAAENPGALPDQVRAFESQYLNTRGVVEKWRDAKYASFIAGWNKADATIFGAIAFGLDSAGVGKPIADFTRGEAVRLNQSSAQVKDATGADGLVDALIEELPSIAVQGFLTRGMGGVVGAATGSARLGQASAALTAYTTAGAQSTGATYASEIAAGTDPAKAREKALKAGANTALITAVFGSGALGGVERVAVGRAATMTVRDLAAMARQKGVLNVAKSPELRKVAADVLKSAGGEATEEGLDELIGAFLTADPDTNLADAWSNAMEAAAVGGFIGGAIDVAAADSAWKSQVVESTPEDRAARVNAEIAAVNPTATPATPEEVAAAEELVGPFGAGPDAQALEEQILQASPEEAEALRAKRGRTSAEEVAAGIEVTRELAAEEAEVEEVVAEAEAGLAEAMALGDPVALEQATAGVAVARAGRSKPARARGVLKIARGETLETLTAAEVRSLGITREGKPMKEEELAAVGLAAPAVEVLADGSLIVLDEALAELSPAARKRVKMNEAQARKKAVERAAAAAAPTPTPAKKKGEIQLTPEERRAYDAGVLPPPPDLSPEEQKAWVDERIAAQAPAAGQKFTVTGRAGTVVEVEAADEQAAKIEGADALPLGETVASVAPVGGAAPAPAPKIAADSPFAPITKRLEKLQAALGESLVVTEDPGERAEIRQGKIYINLPRLVGEAVSGGLSNKEASAWIDKVIDEEVRHLAHQRALVLLWQESGSTEPFGAWYKEYGTRGWKTEFLAKGKAAMVRDIYGKESFATLSPEEKYMEGVRIMSQSLATGSPTEIAKLWQNSGAQVIETIRAALRVLKEMVANLSPALKAEIAAIEAQLSKYEQNTGTVPDRGEKPAEVRETGGDVPGGGKGSDNQTPGGRPSDAGAGGAVLPAGAGSRVSFTRGGERRSGVVVAVATNGTLLVNLDGGGRLTVSQDEVEVAPVAKTSPGVPPEIARMRALSESNRSIRDAEGEVDRAATKAQTARRAAEAGMSPDEFSDAQAAENRAAIAGFYESLEDGDVVTWTDGNGRTNTAKVRVYGDGIKEVRSTTEGASMDYVFPRNSTAFINNAASLTVTKKDATPAGSEPAAGSLSIPVEQMTPAQFVAEYRRDRPNSKETDDAIRNRHVKFITTAIVGSDADGRGPRSFSAEAAAAYGITIPSGWITKEGLVSPPMTKGEPAAGDTAAADGAAEEIEFEIQPLRPGAPKETLKVPANPNAKKPKEPAPTPAGDTAAAAGDAPSDWTPDRQAEYKKLKAELNKAIKSGDKAKIIAEAQRGLARFETIGFPDDWSRWEQVRDDASRPKFVEPVTKPLATANPDLEQLSKDRAKIIAAVAAVPAVVNAIRNTPHNAPLTAAEEVRRILVDLFNAGDLSVASYDYFAKNVEKAEWVKTVVRDVEKGMVPVVPAVDERVFSDTYTGPRWTYGMRNRPLSIGTAPKGFIIGSDGAPAGRARHGTIQYPRKLTEKELYDFEMEVIEDTAPAPPATPTLSADEQAAKDFFNELGEGLEAAPLVPENFYRSKGIPREKRIQFAGIVDGFYDAGVRTPEELVAKLEKIGGGKLRAYTDASWSALRSSYPELPQAGDWAAIYGGIDNSPRTNDATTDDTKDSPGASGDSSQPGESVVGGTGRPAVDSQPGSEDAGAGTRGELPDNGEGAGAGGDSGTVGGNASRPDLGSQTGKAGRRDDTKRGGKRGEEGTGSIQPGNGSGVDGAKSPVGYRLTDPEKIIGAGGPKARFARNKLALETYDTVLSEGRDPTKEEQDILAAYIGWGSFGQELFQGTWERPNPKDNFKTESEWLRDHLGQKGWESIRDSILNAHYTDPPHVQALWRIVEHLGFKGGRVLEPSMGIGTFFGLMPDILRAKSSLTGIELDSVVGGMAKMLYPDANIRIMGYEKSSTADGFYDLVIGNWPFAREGPSDPRYNSLGLSLHDYFFVKALDQTRPGGLVIGITSNGTMDKKGQNTRRQLARRAELVAAFRFPSGAFENYAGTKVVTDVLILKKRESPSADIENDGWINTQERGTAGRTFNANEYWNANPENVLGEMTWGHGTTSGKPGMIVNRQDNYAEALARIEQSLPRDILSEPVARESAPTFQNKDAGAGQNSVVWNEGSASTPEGFYIVRGEQLERLDSVFKWRVADKKSTEKRSDELKQLIGIRDSVQKLLDAQREGNPNTEAVRKEAKDKYDAFVKDHGSIAKSFMVKAMAKAEDPMSRTVENLERKEGKKYVPRDILLKDIMRRPVTDAKGSVEDAFAIQRNQSTTLDIETIAKLSGMPVQEVTDRLIALDQIYLTPTGSWESREEYLGGNVRRKLNEAKDAQSQGMDMERNIESLEKIQPKDVPYFEIEVQMGASWIPRTIYLEFASHLLGGDVGSMEKDFNLTKVLSGWNFKVNNGALESGTNGTGVWGTRRLTFSKIFSAAMNGTTVKVWDTDEDGVKHLNDSQTQLANTKVDAIREELASWLWSDPTRAGQLGVDYNNVKNSEVVPNRSGSHLRFEGLSLTLGTSEFDLRKHQQDAVWRFIMDGRGVGAHEVGTGKTFTMAALAVEGRRLGVFRKTLLFAHNSNAESVYKDFQAAYPGGKFLFINSLNPEVRENAMRQIATDEWDAVIVTHSLIDRFALREETLMQIAKKEITQLESEIADELESLGQTITDAELNDDKAFNKKMAYVKDSHTAKDLVKARNRIIKRIKDKAAKAHGDKAVFFEDLGVDSIMVDEAHIFKKIALATRKQVKGLNKTESERGWMLGALTDTVKSRNNGKGVFLFTGTPLTNNLNEAYNMMRFVMDDTMADVGINGFDDWFNDFAASVTDTEWTTGGTLEPVTRLLSFVNVPELARLAGRYFDVVQAKNMPEFIARESTEGKSAEAIGRPFKTIRSVTAEMTERQKAHKESVKERYERFQRLDGKGKRLAMLNGVDTPIQLESEGTKAALDIRLLDRNAPDDPNSKVNMMLKNAFEHYTEDDQSTQMIFMEQGFNDYTDSMVAVKNDDGETMKDAEGKTITQKRRRPKFNLVRDMVEKLVAQGVKPEEIAVFSNMSLDTIADRPDDVLRKVVRPRGKTVSKEDISALMREGKIRFAIGSTQTMGTGVNAQTHMRAMHHLDAPWTPGEFEQRNGRGHRQGNQWNTVFEYRYYTEGSHDVRRWQVLLNKVKFISRFTEMLVNAGGSDLRVLTGDGADLGESGENVADFEQSLSTAAGDPRIMIRAKLKTDVDKLDRKRDSHFQAIARAQEDIRQLRERKASDAQRIERGGQMIEAIADARAKPFEVVIDGKTFTERAEAETFLAAYPSLTQADNGKSIINYHGIEVIHSWNTRSSEPSEFYARIPTKGKSSEKVGLGKLSIASLENNLRGQARALNNLKESFDTIDPSIASLQAMTERPFTRDPELAAKRKALQQIEVELSRAPHAPPSWLRQGAPVGSLVYLEDGKAYDVAAHRWDENGWWILVEDKNGMRPVDYRKVFDESGHEMFEAVPFVRPVKIKEFGYARSSDLANSTPANHTRIDETDERGAYGVIYYSRPLSDSQIRSFNLKAVAEREQAPEPVEETAERREIVKPSTPLPLFDSERYRKRDGRLATLRRLSEKLQDAFENGEGLSDGQQESRRRIDAEIAAIEKAKYQESMRGETSALRAAPLSSTSPEWLAMTPDERAAYLKARGIDSLPDAVEKSLTAAEKQEAADILGDKTWTAATAKAFSKRMADWMVSASDASARLTSLFRKVLNTARKTALSIAVAISVTQATSPNAQAISVQSVVQEITVPAPVIAPKLAPAARPASPPRPAPAAPSVKRADFRGKAVSSDTRTMAGWVMKSGDNASLPFAIADKKSGMISFFDGDGNLAITSPALFGRAPGDLLTAKQLAKPIEESRLDPSGHITPAGRFEADYNDDSDYGAKIDFLKKKNSVIAIHRVFTGRPAENRPGRLSSKSPVDNRISLGCINVPDSVADSAIPAFKSGGVVYVLPETPEGKSIFEGFKGLKAAPLSDSETPENIRRLTAKGRATMADAETEAEARKQQAEFADQGKVVGDPLLANPGESEESRNEWDVATQLYRLEQIRQSEAAWKAEGTRRVNVAPDAVAEKLLDDAFGEDGSGMRASDYVAARILIERRTKSAGSDQQAHADNFVLQYAYRTSRGELARAMRSGVDWFQTPAERHRDHLAGTIYSLPPKVLKQIEAKNWTPAQKREAIRRAGLKRIQEIEKVFKGLGITIEEVVGGQVFLSLSQTAVMKDALSRLSPAERAAIKAIQKGATVADVRRKTGLPDAKIQELATRVRKELADKLRAKVAAGMKLEDLTDDLKGLRAASLSAADIEAELERILTIGFGLPREVPTARLPKKRAVTQPDDENDPNAAAKRVARRWIDRLATSQSDTLAWKDKVKMSKLEALIREHLKKPVPDFIEKAMVLGATAEQARVLDGEASTERQRAEMIRQWRKDNPKPRKAKPTVVSADWNRPEFADELASYTFDAEGRSEIMHKVIALRNIVSAGGKIETLTGKKKVEAIAIIDQMNKLLAKDGMTVAKVLANIANKDDYRFDISDWVHVQILARMISAIDADFLDKGSEFYYASILSGLQTMMVNATAIGFGAWEATIGRAVELAVNSIARDPASAQFGEVKYILKAAGPWLSRAASNFAASWASETPFFEEDILGRAPEIGKAMEGRSLYKTGSIGGKVGKFIRTPMRILLATDDFVKTAIACTEVGAMAYRLGVASGLKPGTKEFDSFMKKQVNIPGSLAWTKAATKAAERTFTQSLPTQHDPITEQRVPIRGIGDVVGAGAAKLTEFVSMDTDNMAAKAGLLALRLLFFPFQRVPFNIVRQGARRMLNPISAVDIAYLFASNSITRNEDGKVTWKWNAGGQNAEVVERLAQQAQGGLLLLLLLATGIGEGDDDDLEKKILITGSRPFRGMNKGDREAAYDAGLGPYRISMKLPNGNRIGFNYGRIEPAATVLGSTIDTMREMGFAKDGKQSYGEAASKVAMALTSQLTEKTFLRGFSDAQQIVNGESDMNRFAAERLAVLIAPNLIRQVVRETDPVFREKPDDFIEALSYAVWPHGQLPAKRDLYGEVQEKEGNSFSRVFDFTDAGLTEQSPYSEMLRRWRLKDPKNDADQSTPQSAGNRYTPKGAKKPVEMTPPQTAEFKRVAGLRTLVRLKATPLNLTNPTEYDIKRFKDAVDSSREDARKILFNSPAWQNLK